MSFNPHEYLLPAATQFRLHPGSVAERVFRNLETRLTHRDSPRTGSPTAFFQAFTPQAPVAIVSCPLDPQWGASDRRNLDALFGRFSEVDFVICARANRAQP